MTFGVISVSTFGSLGPEAHRLLSRISRRVGRRVPAQLHDLATWAAPSFAPFARMALGLAARRGVAEMVGRLYRRADVEVDLDDVDEADDGPSGFAPIDPYPDSDSESAYGDDDAADPPSPPRAPPGRPLPLPVSPESSQSSMSSVARHLFAAHI